MAISSPELGWGLRSIGRLAKKAAKGAVKYSGTGLIVKGNIALAKLSAKLALLPLILLRRALVTLGRALCKAPPQVLALAAEQANIDPAWVPLFCKAVQANSWGFSTVRKMLPPALKLAGKLAATGAFPPIVPAMAIIKRIPGVGKFAGAELGSYSSNLRNPQLRRSVDAMETLALADYLGLLEDTDAAAMGLGDADRDAMQGYLADTVEGAEGVMSAENVKLGIVAGAGALGLFLALRKS